MKFIIPLVLTLTACAWGMETKTEKEPLAQELQPFFVGTFKLNVKEKRFSDEIMDEVSHYAGEIGAIYTGKYFRLKDKIEALEKKIAARSELQTTDENINHYYTSKLAYLKNKLSYKQELKDSFSTLPEIFNRVLLLVLKAPKLTLNPDIQTRQGYPPKIICYTLYDFETWNITQTSDHRLPLLLKKYPLLSQLNLEELTSSKQDYKIWETIMETLDEYRDEKRDDLEVIDPQNERLYEEYHYVIKAIKKVFPKNAQEALAPLKAMRSEYIERRKDIAKEYNEFGQSMIDLLKKINKALETFQKDVEALYISATQM